MYKFLMLIFLPVFTELFHKGCSSFIRIHVHTLWSSYDRKLQGFPVIVYLHFLVISAWGLNPNIAYTINISHDCISPDKALTALFSFVAFLLATADWLYFHKQFLSLCGYDKLKFIFSYFIFHSINLNRQIYQIMSLINMSNNINILQVLFQL